MFPGSNPQPQPEPTPKPRLVHKADIGASKWSLGKALCGCTTSRWTPVGQTLDDVTCPRCRSRIIKPKIEYDP